MEVRLRNSGEHALKVTVQDNSYEAATIAKTIPGVGDTSIILPLSKSHGWYDFTVSSEASSAMARYAGHVDTGRPSSSDPLMGAV